jgi:pyrophosphate--fructose-6-phosphate 1-phosphotransferase
MAISALQKARAAYAPKLPPALRQGAAVKAQSGAATAAAGDVDKIKALFPKNFGKPVLAFAPGGQVPAKAPAVGVILSGGQAPGGHNVIAGLFDGLKSLHPDAKLYGFLGGPGGLVDNKVKELTAEVIAPYRNTGGFDMIQSGRTKLEKTEQFDQGRANCAKLGISALVVVGGDDSNTNACLLAEYYAAQGVPIQVIGCPKTIDGDLKNEQIEASFGFDTATKVYSELVGNIQRDANSARKYWHFIRLMGRSASHIALECALQTHPNATLIGEEVAAHKQTLQDIVESLVSVIVKRAAQGDNFGVALVPEGLVEFVPEMKRLIAELNDLLAKEEAAFNALAGNDEKRAFVAARLDAESGKVYASLPALIQLQLILDRDPHGNVQVSLIETEKLLVEMIQARLKALKKDGTYKGKFAAQTHFFGYEGRCAAPSNYDADYCYSLGFAAAALVGAGCTGYMASVRNTDRPADEWTAGGIPLTMMMNVERRHGEDKPVIRKALVDLDGKPFQELVRHREAWALKTDYVYPGPIQYFGPAEVCDPTTVTLALEKQA